ncbi:MAG: hypothetical protein ACK4NN_13300, partial [Rheinheimera sp.]
METLVQYSSLLAFATTSGLKILVHQPYSVEKKNLLALDRLNSNASGSYNEFSFTHRFNTFCRGHGQ